MDILNSTLEQTFWSKVKIGGLDDCWEWQASIKPNGYGQIGIGNRKVRLAHRVAWWLTYGPIPDEMDVLHKCDNPPCCNPNHLWLGTQKDNTQDMIKKGRFFFHIHPEKHVRGEKHGQAKLTAQQVTNIRQTYSLGNINMRQLAKQYNVAQTLISRIIRNEIWKHLT